MRVGLRFCEEKAIDASFTHLDRRFRRPPPCHNSGLPMLAPSPVVLSSSVIVKRGILVWAKRRILPRHAGLTWCHAGFIAQILKAKIKCLTLPGPPSRANLVPHVSLYPCRLGSDSEIPS
jgi:hypothetical protein